MLSMLGKNFSIHVEIFFGFSQEIEFDKSYKLSNLHKIQFSRKYEKNIVNLSSTVFAHITCLVLRGLDTRCRFLASFQKGDNFSDFLFAWLHPKPHL